MLGDVDTAFPDRYSRFDAVVRCAFAGIQCRRKHLPAAVCSSISFRQGRIAADVDSVEVGDIAE